MSSRKWQQRIEDIEVQIFAPEIPWRLMGGMRNVVVHEYFQVDARRIWETSIDDLPTIIEPLNNLLNK